MVLRHIPGDKTRENQGTRKFTFKRQDTKAGEDSTGGVGNLFWF
jgi:hypothetical protein